MLARFGFAALAATLALASPARAQTVAFPLVSGAASATGTGATEIIAAPATLKLYITAVQCGRDDAGTTAIRVTFNDSAATVLVLPNSGGGGGNNANFTASPLTVAATTHFTFTASAGTTTVRCSAQGYNAP